MKIRNLISFAIIAGVALSAAGCKKEEKKAVAWFSAGDSSPDGAAEPGAGDTPSAPQNPAQASDGKRHTLFVQTHIFSGETV